jgi:glutathione S-transferase
MSLILYYHPLASYCWKALIALYEAGVPFDKQLVELFDPEQRRALLKLNPLGKFPVLCDTGRGEVIAESSILIEYLAQHVPSASRLLPSSAADALRVRARDRFFDLYVMDPMAKIVTDKLRPASERDGRGVEESRAVLGTAYGMAESFLVGSTWAAGEEFTLADCAAAPALFYANKVRPFGDEHAHVRAYLERLEQRPSFARVLSEAAPYFALFPG